MRLLTPLILLACLGSASAALTGKSCLALEPRVLTHFKSSVSGVRPALTRYQGDGYHTQVQTLDSLRAQTKSEVGVKRVNANGYPILTLSMLSLSPDAYTAVFAYHDGRRMNYRAQAYLRDGRNTLVCTWAAR